MNRLFFTLGFLLAAYFSQAQTPDSIFVDCDYTNYSLTSFLEQLETKTPCRFFYDSALLQNIKISVTGKHLNLYDALDDALRFTTYDYLFIEPDLIVLLEKNNKIFKVNLSENLKLDENIVNEDLNEGSASSKYLKGRKAQETVVITVGRTDKQRIGKKAYIDGKILEADNGDPLIGATIYLSEIGYGSATNENGDVSMKIPVGKYSAEFRCIGMADSKCLLDVRSDGSFVYKMNKEIHSIDEVTVNANQNYAIRGSQAGLDKISIHTIKEIPTLMGEKDIVRVSQMLPGIVSVSEGSGGINVRGGNADQNLFYLNEVPIYNTSHVFGFFSSFNSAIVDDFSIYKGYVPPNYGGRLSSVFAIDTRKGNKHKFYGSGSVSPISASAEFEGPIIKDKCSFVLSGRSSYSDWILQKLPNDQLKNSSVKFYDLASSLDYQIDEKNRVNLFVYQSYDYFDLNGLSQIDYANRGLGANYFHQINDKLLFRLHLIYSNYNFINKDLNNATEAYSHDYALNHTEIKSNFTWNAFDKHKIGFGAGTINYSLNRGTIEPYGFQSIRSVRDLGREHGLESSIYLEDTYSVNSRLKLNFGIRDVLFLGLGPKDVYEYTPDLPVIADNIKDTLSFGVNQITCHYSKPEIRLSADYKTSALSSVKFAYNEMSQYMFLLSNSYAITPSDQWKMVDYHIKPGFSRLASLGYYQTLVSLGVTASVESYVKRTDNILEFKDGADFINEPNVEISTLQGRQNAYGIEFMVAKDEGTVNGWVSYTYSHSRIKVDGVHDWDKINNGETYFSNYDKPNVFNFTGNYKVTRRIIFSSNISYSTGRPITLPKSIYSIEGMKFVNYTARNAGRIPDYFRMDLSLTLEGSLKAKKLVHSTWMFNIYNLTGRKNPYSIYFISNQGKIEGYKYSIIGVPIFTISWNFKLGNYSDE